MCVIDMKFNASFVNLLIGALVCVALVEVCLIASFFIDENNGTEDEHFGTDANEWPQGGELAFHAHESLHLCLFSRHDVARSDAVKVASVAQSCLVDDQLAVSDLLVSCGYVDLSFRLIIHRELVMFVSLENGLGLVLTLGT